MAPPSWDEVACAYLEAAESQESRCLQLGLANHWAIEAAHAALVDRRAGDLLAWVALMHRIESASAEHYKLFLLQEFQCTV